MYDTCGGVVIPGVLVCGGGGLILGGSLQVATKCEPLGRPYLAASCSKKYDLAKSLLILSKNELAVRFGMVNVTICT